MNTMDFVEEKINLEPASGMLMKIPRKHAFNKKAGLKLANEAEVKIRSRSKQW